MRGLTLLAIAVAFAPPAAAAGPLDGVSWAQHPGAFVAGVVVMAVGAVLGLAAIVALLGVVAPAVRGATDRHARTASPGWTTLAGALVAVGVAGLLGWASKAGPAAGTVAALALGLPAALLFLAGVVATLPALGERLLAARTAPASPLAHHLVGSAVLLLALAGSAAVNLHPVVLAIAVGWPLGTGLGALLAALRRPRPAAPPPS